jgi:hypothetical protein
LEESWVLREGRFLGRERFVIVGEVWDGGDAMVAALLVGWERWRCRNGGLRRSPGKVNDDVLCLYYVGLEVRFKVSVEALRFGK